jgi:hypothetical protein
LQQTNGDREYYSVQAKPVNRRAALLCLGLRITLWPFRRGSRRRFEPPAPEFGRSRWRLPLYAPMVANVTGDAF